MMAMAEIPNPQESRAPQLAIRVSLAIGFFMLGTKLLAYGMTGSAAILSDAAESVVHVVAVSFAAYSLWLSRKPPDPSHLYGHDKVAFFSAGFEGAMIVLAAVYIVYESIRRLIAGPKLENLGAGALLILVAGVINGALGGYLLWVGKKYGSLILEADGRHVLTDCLTSLGVVVGLGLTILTGWLRFDPIVAILVALDILWMGSKLIRQSIGGLMDEVDPADPGANPAIAHRDDFRSRGGVSWIAASQCRQYELGGIPFALSQTHFFGICPFLGHQN